MKELLCRDTQTIFQFSSTMVSENGFFQDSVFCLLEFFICKMHSKLGLFWGGLRPMFSEGLKKDL